MSPDTTYKGKHITPIFHASGIHAHWDKFKGFPQRFRVPDNLLIITVDDRKKSFVEKQFEHHGSNDLVALKPDIKPWSNTLRLRPYVEYLKSDKTKDKEYVIFCDSDDVLFFESPDSILNSFVNEFDCGLLYNSTPFWVGYEETNLLSQANKRKANQHHPGQYLNAGLYIGRKDFVIEVYEDVLNYVIDNPPMPSPASVVDKYGRCTRNTTTAKAKSYYDNWRHEIYKPNFPASTGSDQVILRHLEFKYWPKLQLDTGHKLLRRY